jgi:menaquinone-dependent protoporphyrinogen oxidase
VWLFSVGSFGDRHPIVGGLIKKEPKEISEFEQTLHPRDYRVFAGVVDLDHWPAWGRILFKALGGHAGDNRQWPDIDAWAEEIGHAFGSRTPTHGESVETRSHNVEQDHVREVACDASRADGPSHAASTT